MNIIDTLINYFGSQQKLAAIARVSQPFISLVRSGRRKFGTESCIRIATASNGLVRCEDLRPDVDWAFLRGTSKKSPKKAA